jgi:hypothetical protein
MCILILGAYLGLREPVTRLRIVLLGWPQPQYHTMCNGGRVAEGKVNKGEQRRKGGEMQAGGGGEG